MHTARKPHNVLATCLKFDYVRIINEYRRVWRLYGVLAYVQGAASRLYIYFRKNQNWNVYESFREMVYFGVLNFFPLFLMYLMTLRTAANIKVTVVLDVASYI